MRVRPRTVAALVVIAFALGALLVRGDRAPDSRVPSDAGYATVTKVSDGDTIWLSQVGKVRLIGIDTPEVFGHVDCYGPASSAFAKRVLRIGLRVRYRVGRESHDRYGRTLAYVWLPDGRLFNQVLAEDGYARPLTIEPNDDYAPLFAKAARRAREAHRGLWGSCPAG